MVICCCLPPFVLLIFKAVGILCGCVVQVGRLDRNLVIACRDCSIP